MTAPRRTLALSALTIRGYKAIREQQQLQIRPLTLIAGVNSAGKSSLLQPLLLMKQTLESSYAAGPLLLDGPHVKFRNASELRTQFRSRSATRVPLEFGVAVGEDELQITFAPAKVLEVQRVMFSAFGRMRNLRAGMTNQEIRTALKGNLDFFNNKAQLQVVPRRFLLEVVEQGRARGSFAYPTRILDSITSGIQQVLHLPGLRGNPERSYARTGIEPPYAGPFPVYAASVLAAWEEQKSGSRDGLIEDLSELGLTWKVAAETLSDTEIAVRVGRLPSPQRGGAHDLVSIADVGVGVSQVLPFLVALHAAKPGHLVYVEEPEIHLHPRAQVALARVLARAVERGVRIVAETHSPLLLLALQTQIANGRLDPEDVNLAWAERDEDGYTKVKQVSPEETGSFGDWPVDFADVELSAQRSFLDAATARAAGRSRSGRS